MTNGDSSSIGNGQLEGTTNESFYKEYRFSNGKVLRFTKEEFYQVVEAFKMLHAQDQLNSQKHK